MTRTLGGANVDAVVNAFIESTLKNLYKDGIPPTTTHHALELTSSSQIPFTIMNPPVFVESHVTLQRLPVEIQDQIFKMVLSSTPLSYSKRLHLAEVWACYQGRPKNTYRRHAIQRLSKRTIQEAEATLLKRRPRTIHDNLNVTVTEVDLPIGIDGYYLVTVIEDHVQPHPQVVDEFSSDVEIDFFFTHVKNEDSFSWFLGDNDEWCEDE